MRNPNGYGTVFKLKGKRRRPWVARITVDFKDNGQPNYEYLGYYEKQQDAILVLAKYNDDPYDLANAKFTFSQIYDLWAKWKFTDKGKDIIRGYVAAYKQCTTLQDMLFTDIRTAHMQVELDKWNAGHSSKKNMRLLFRQMYDYAKQNDIVEKDYSEFVTLEAPEEKAEGIHKPFTDKELETLWNHSEDKAAQIVLIFCYTGMRPTEFIKIKTKDVFLSDRYMIGGIKTKNGKNRAIPIAEKIYKFIENMYNPDNEYLLVDSDGALNYHKLASQYWQPLMQKLNMQHLPHDGRHTCTTLLDNASVNQTIIKKILGHAGSGTTEKVYTHKTVQQLVEAINKI